MKQFNKNYKSSYYMGSTASVLLITQTKLWIGNAGDSRIILCRKDGTV